MCCRLKPVKVFEFLDQLMDVKEPDQSLQCVRRAVCVDSITHPVRYPPHSVTHRGRKQAIVLSEAELYALHVRAMTRHVLVTSPCKQRLVDDNKLVLDQTDPLLTGTCLSHYHFSQSHITALTFLPPIPATYDGSPDTQRQYMWCDVNSI